MKPPITLLFGSGNAGKLNAMKGQLAGLPIHLMGLGDIKAELPPIDESGAGPLENAKIKALAYYKATHMPVFSCDSGLYIKNAPQELQPGVHVRRLGDKCLNDDEMIDYYSQLANLLGGNITVRYQNGICLVMNESESYEYMGDDIAGEEFIITSKPHPQRTPGFPLDSLSVHIETGKYYYDMHEFKNRTSMERGFRNFFKRTLDLGEP